MSTEGVSSIAVCLYKCKKWFLTSYGMLTLWLGSEKWEMMEKLNNKLSNIYELSEMAAAAAYWQQ